MQAAHDIGAEWPQGLVMDPFAPPSYDRFSSSVIRDLLSQASQPGVLSLAGGLPATEALPVERFEGAIGTVVEQHGPRVLHYGLSGGEPKLLEALAMAQSIQDT